MSIWVWIKMGICAAVLLAGLVMILLAVVKRKNRKLPGLIFQLAAGAVLAVAGAVLLAGPLMMGSRERTLADQRNYVAVRLMEMGDYANGASMAAQADQLSPNDASKQLMVLAAGFQLDTGRGLRYIKIYRQSMGEDAILLDAETALTNYQTEQGALDTESEDYETARTQLEEELRSSLMTLLYQVKEEIPSFDDSESVAQMLSLVQQGYYSGDLPAEDSLMADEVAAVYAIQTADYQAMLENAMSQFEKSDSFENRASVANVVANQSRLYNPQDEEIIRLQQQIWELEAEYQQVYDEYNQLTDAAAKQAKQEESEQILMEIDSLEELAEIKAAGKAINFIEVTTPVEEKSTVLYKIEMARLYYQAREEDKAEDFMVEVLETVEEGKSDEPAAILMMDMADYYQTDNSDTDWSSYQSQGENAGTEGIWNSIENLFDYFGADGNEYSYYGEQTDRDFYTWLLEVLDHYYHGLIIRRIDTSRFPTVRVTVNVAVDTEGEITENSFHLEDMSESQDFSLLSQQELEGEETDTSLVLVVDRSGSMEGQPMDDTKAAVANFARTAPENMRMGLVTFDDVTESTPISTERNTLRQMIDATYARGGTSIALGLAEAGEMLSGESGRRVIILLSDGADGSADLIDEVLAELNRQDIIVYTIGFGGVDVNYMTYIAQSCGGQFMQAESTEVLGQIYAQIGTTMTNDYVLEFEAMNEPEEFLRNMEVSLTGEDAFAQEEYHVGVSPEDIAAEQGQEPLANYFRQIGGSGVDAAEQGASQEETDGQNGGEDGF